MRGIRFVLLFFLLPACVKAESDRNVTVAGGGMQFNGKIIAESCRVEDGDRLMVIKLGKVSSNRFSYVGEDVNPIPFDIHLTDCNTAVSQRVSVGFYGVEDGKNPEILSVGEGPEIASGIGIALFDNQNNLIPLNRPPLYWTSVHTGLTTLHFVAKYRATSREVNGGVVDAHAWFALTYL